MGNPLMNGIFSEEHHPEVLDVHGFGQIHGHDYQRVWVISPLFEFTGKLQFSKNRTIR
jgi:hypothetical protein